MARNKLYYPDGQITNNLYCYGEYMTEDGIQYFGLYHKYSDGSIMTEAYYNKDTSVSLIPYRKTDTEISYNTNVYIYDKLTNNKYKNSSLCGSNNTQITPIPFYPIFAQSCYDKGIAYRYFIKKAVCDNIRNSTDLFEISCDYYNAYNTQQIDNILYRVVKIPWKLTGPVNDEQKNIFNKVSGVYDTNKRTVNSYCDQFKGLEQYLTNFLELSIWDSAINFDIRKMYNGYTADEVYM